MTAISVSSPDMTELKVNQAYIKEDLRDLKNDFSSHENEDTDRFKITHDKLDMLTISVTRLTVTIQVLVGLVTFIIPIGLTIYKLMN